MKQISPGLIYHVFMYDDALRFSKSIDSHVYRRFVEATNTTRFIRLHVLRNVKLIINQDI